MIEATGGRNSTKRRSGGLRRIALASLVVAPLLAAGCQVIAGIEDRSNGAMTSVIGGGIADGSTDSPNGRTNDEMDATCILTTIPAPPDASGGTSTDDVSIVAVMNSMLLPGTTHSQAPVTYGLDLDGVCTCCDGGCSKANAGTCKPNGTTSVCDALGGVDNAGSILIDEFQASSQGAGFSELNVNAGIVGGMSSILMQIRNFNGSANDDSVELSFFVSTGFAAQAGGPKAPRFDGTDTWNYSEEGVLDTDAAVPTDSPSFRSTAAYVRDGTLYANLSTLDITIGDVAMNLAGVQIRAAMEQDDAGGIWHFSNGIMGARWPASSFLERFGNSTINPDCTPSSMYLLLKAELCPYADLTADPSKGGNGVTDPSADPTCDAISLQIGFTAVSALFGSPEPAISEPTPCPGFVYECP